MAVRYFETFLDFQDPVETLLDPSRTISGADSDGTPEVNLGAFRGFAYALIFETVVVILGGLAWQIFRVIR